MFDNIDVSRLSRDYSKEPLKRGERPTKEDLEYLYLELNLDREIISSFLGCGKSLRNIKKFLSEYDIKKDYAKISESRKSNCLKKYGVTSVFGIESVKEKISKTNLEKYGFTNPSSSDIVKNKRKSTFTERYGVDNPTKNEEIKKKVANTLLERYGVDNYTKTDEYKQAVRKTNIEKYGVVHSNQRNFSELTKEALSSRESLVNFIKESELKSSVLIAKKLGIDLTTLHRYAERLGVTDSEIFKYISSYEEELKRELNNIYFIKDRTILNGQEIDLYSPEHKIGIEFNGNYWHSDKFKDKYYHKNKSLKAKENGVFLYHIFEYEWMDSRVRKTIIERLKNIFSLNLKKIYARKCSVREVVSNEAYNFLNANHIQGNVYSGIRLGLYYNDELVSLMEFSKNPINKNYQYELSRFCSKSGCNVVGGASKLFKYFVKTYNPISVISYSDIAKTTGNIYLVLGFKKDHITAPQYWWTNGVNTFSRYECQLDRLIGRGWKEEFDTRTENDVMRSRGYYKLYDCGKIVWTWKSGDKI